MDMTGEYRIAAPRERVWQALNDPETLRQCIPGCETLERRSDTEFSATAKVAVGPVKARFGGDVTLSDLNPPESYNLNGEGKGAAGFARGGAKVVLVAEGDGGTVLRYEVHAAVGGKLAQLGARLIDATARKMAADFFGRFAVLVGPEAAPAAAREPSPDAAPSPSPSPVSVAKPAPAPPPMAEIAPETALPRVPPQPDLDAAATAATGDAGLVAAAGPHADPAPAATGPAGFGLPPWAWISALIAIVIVLIVLFQ